MKMRFVFLEDGGRLFQMSAMAPEAFWSAALKKMEPMLASLELRQVAGSIVPLFPGRPAPASVSSPESAMLSVVEAKLPEATSETPAPAALPTAVMTPAEFLAMALAEDTALLDPELPMNVNLRDRGAGLVPRIHEADPGTRAVLLGVGALAGFLRVPFGWHVIDDGRRTLVFDAGGRIQVSLSQRGSNGVAPSAHARQLLEPYLERQPDLPKIEATLDQISAAGLRGVDVDGVCLDQYFLIRDLGRPDSHLVARVTATAEDAKRALDLAGDLLATFRPAETISMSRT